MKVLIATEKPFAAEATQAMKKVIEDAGFELVLLEKYTSKEDLLNSLDGVNALIVRSDKVDREIVEACRDLKIVVRAGAGYDNIDLEACTDRQVVVMNTPGQNSNAVAELVFGLLLKCYRNNFSGSTGRELKGKKIGLHAFGHVGHAVSNIARGFGMQVFAYDPFLNKERMQQLGVTPIENVEQLYSHCDIVSLHIPATKQTIESINRSLVERMPKHGVLVNTARKEVIHEMDLLGVLKQRIDLSYLSDIKPSNLSEFELLGEQQVFFTPKKMGAQTQEANYNAGLAAAQQVVGYLLYGEECYRVN